MFERTLMLAVFSSLAFGAAAQTPDDQREFDDDGRLDRPRRATVR